MVRWGVPTLGVLAVLLSACSARPLPTAAGTSAASVSPPASSSPASSSPVASSAVPSSRPPVSSSARRTTAAPARPSSPAATHSVAPPPTHVSAAAPLVVIDPGHSVTVHGTDPGTGLDVSDYENEPEMRDVYSVASLVRAKLVAAGYRVLLTKPSLDTPTSLGRRAQLANAAGAALALSIHDQAGSNGGIGFDQGNNIVYYQAVGDYRTNPAGRRIYFTDSALAARSKRYAEIFQEQRSLAQGTSITLQGNTGYDLGGRGLQGGDIWIVQLLSHVPWIYNEAGGNSAGMSGLDSADRERYANGLVAAVKACLPLDR